MADTLQSVRQALRVLRLLEGYSPSRVTDVAHTLGVSVSTAHRLLSTLVAEQFVTRVSPGHRYSLASGITLTAPSELLARCIKIARDEIRVLRDISGETVHLAVLRGFNTRFVSVMESEHVMKVTNRVGTEAPAHTTAAGKMLLSYRADDDIRSLYRQRAFETPTPYCISSLEMLLQHVRKARADGYARNIAESEIGIYTMAVPIHDSRGRPVCCLSVAGPNARIGARSHDTLTNFEAHILGLLNTYAQRIEHALASHNVSTIR